jgi:hypothetical protein
MRELGFGPLVDPECKTGKRILHFLPAERPGQELVRATMML